jgi:hypothetical protein
MIFAKAGWVIKAMTAIGLRKRADGDRHPLHNGDCGIIEQQRVADQTPQPLVDRPLVSRLAQSGRPLHQSHQREKVRVVMAEVVKDFLVLREAQIRPHDFHRYDLAIGQLRHRTDALASVFLSWHLAASRQSHRNR